jgi:hypothetical protein
MENCFCRIGLVLALGLFPLSLIADYFLLPLEAVTDRQHLTLYAELGQVGTRFRLPVRAESSLQLTLEVPASIDANSIMLSDNSGETSVRELRYQNDLLNRESWQSALLGQQVEYQIEGDHPLGPQLSGRLLSFDPDLLEVDGTLILTPPGTLVFAKQDFVVTPKLYWQLEGDFSESRIIDVSYMASGLSWSASHNLVLDFDESSTAFMTWADIVNLTDQEYKLDSLSLVAGDLNSPDLAGPGNSLRSAMAESSMNRLGPDVSAEHRSLKIYHEYQYNRPVRILRKGTLRLPLIGQRVLRSELVYQLRSNVSLYNNPQQPVSQPVNTLLRLNNTEHQSVGGSVEPIPGGMARIYYRDDQGAIRFMGEDWLASIPEDVPAELTVGRAFDVTVKRWQTDFRRISDRVVIVENTLVFHNASHKAVRVEVQEQLAGDWELLEESMPSEASGDLNLNYLLAIPAGKQYKLVYKIRARR